MAIGQHVKRAVRYPHDSGLSMSSNGRHLEIIFPQPRRASYPGGGIGGIGCWGLAGGGNFGAGGGMRRGAIGTSRAEGGLAGGWGFGSGIREL